MTLDKSERDITRSYKKTYKKTERNRVALYLDTKKIDMNLLKYWMLIVNLYYGVKYRNIFFNEHQLHKAKLKMIFYTWNI